MARIGDTVNAALGAVDYRPLMAAQARASERIGASLQSGIGAVDDAIKQRKDYKNTVKNSSEMIDAAMRLFGDDMGYLGGVAETLGNEEIPLSQRAQLGEQIGALINMGVTKMKDDQQLQLQNRGMELDEARLGMAQETQGLRTRAMQSELDAAEKAKLDNEQFTAFAARPALDYALRMVRESEARGDQPMIDSERLKAAFTYSDPTRQMRAAEAALAGLPEQVVSQPMKIMGTNDQGQPVELMATFDGRQFNPVPIAPVAGVGPTALNAAALPAPLQPYAGAFQEYGAKYGVDPKVLAAIAMHETGNGTSSAFRNKNNAMGVSNSNGPISMPSVEASIEKMAKLLGSQSSGPYRNASTVPEIAGIYAPIGAGNDPGGLNRHWTARVSRNIQALGGDPNAPVRITPGAVKGTPKTTTEQALDEARLAKMQAEAEAAKAETEGQAVADSDAIAKMRSTIALTRQIEESPGFAAAVGVQANPLQSLPGSDKRETVAMIEQLKGKQFLDAVKQMRGMGALSNAEGEKIAQAAGRLDIGMSEDAFKRALAEIRQTLEEAITRRGGNDPAPVTRSAATSRLKSLQGQ